MSSVVYRPTIGIETHVQLKTKTKLFAAVGNDARDATPNSLISHICVGLPGALPVLNRRAVELSTLAAYALGTEPQKSFRFERKHYFYPDLPKGYQITQYEEPIITGGTVTIAPNGQDKVIRIERANLEEDAGKNTHPPGADYSLVDLNRAGTPLLEIVSQPDIHSPAEAKAYVRELYLLMKYAGVTDGDLYHGHMRFDVNISVSTDKSKLGTRSEIKNLNSFRSVGAAVAYEIKRQTELLEKGGKVVQETRGWDEAKQKTFAQRTKEAAEDYRYMPEPDIPPLQLDEAYLKDIKKQMPKLPKDWRKILNRLSISSAVVEELLDKRKILGFIENLLNDPDNNEAVKKMIFWFTQAGEKALPPLNNEESKLVKKHLIELTMMQLRNQISSNAADEIFAIVLEKVESPQKIAKEKALLQVSDESVIDKIVSDVITANPKVVADIKAGQTKAIGWLVGQVMAATKGQANPALAQKIVKRYLDV